MLHDKYATVRFILLLLVALSASIDSTKAGDFDETGTTLSPAFNEHFYDFIRPRLGHLTKNDGFMNIYEEYKASILASNDKELKKVGINDWRNVRPTGELCVDFLTGFQVKDYSMAKPYDIIMIDACLDWLFDNSSEKKLDLDRFNEITKNDHDKLLADSELKSIFNKTKFKGDQIPKELKDKLHEYFSRLLQIFAENPRSGCNGLFLAAYDDFIEDVYLGDCEEDNKCEYFSKYAKFDGIKRDTYLNLIIDSTKQATKSCYSIVQKQMVERMHQAYEDEPMQASIQRKFKKINSKAARQSTEMKWGREMMRILQITSNKNDDDVVDLAEVVEVLKGIKEDDEDVKENFTSAIAAYAIKEVDPKDTAGDANGRARFGKALMDLCKPYIDKKSFLVKTGGSHLWEEDPNSKRKPFEFFDMVYSLVRITNHMSFYRTSKDKFENDVLKNGWEALYLATFSCHIISTTWGELSYDTNKPEFSVMLRRNYHDSIDDWPLDIMYQELTKKSAASQSSEKQPRQGGKSKFSLFRKGSQEPSEPEQIEQEVVVPPTAAPTTTTTTTTTELPAILVPQGSTQQISLSSIEMFKNLHGRYPHLSKEVKDKYSMDLPADLSGSYPKTLGQMKPVTSAPIKKQSWRDIDPLSI